MEESINREQKPLDLQRECVSLQSVIRESFPGRCQDIRMYSPLTLAYVGDAIYDLIIRTMVVELSLIHN